MTNQIINKYFLCLLPILFFYKLTAAQTFRPGVVVGMNISKLKGKIENTYNYAGFKTGVRMVYDFHPQLRASMDLQFSRKGNFISHGQSLTHKFDNIRLDYIEVPIMITFMDWMHDPNEEEYYRLHFSVGFSFGRQLDQQVIDNTGQEVSDMRVYDDSTFNMLGGITYNFNRHWGLNVLYLSSFTDINKGESILSLKNRNWSINLIYLIDNHRIK